MMTYREQYEAWCQADFLTEKEKSELLALKDEKEIEDRFYKDLEFGTAGMRGVMGLGLNRMNRYTVRRSTSGLAEYLIQEKTAHKGVVIAYDCRNHSKEFAQEAAAVLGARNIPVWLCEELEPTPFLSFAVRHYQAAGGIVITASHNPKEYNGYKVYDENGCQLLPEAATKLIGFVKRVQDIQHIPCVSLEEGPIYWVGQEVVETYIRTILKESVTKGPRALSVVYTPLHGAGNIPVRMALKADGFTEVTVVPEQEKSDGQFPTLASPNPEEEGALRLAISLGKKIGAHLVLGTDPDSDRIGIAVRHDDEFVLVSGNQLGALLVHFLLEKKTFTAKERGTIIKTIVTGELGAAIAKKKGIDVVETLTGFKYIGEKMTAYEQQRDRTFILGYEESYGYLVGMHARDKDAVVTAMLICEMADEYKKQGKDLIMVLEDLYKEYGFYYDHLDSYTLKGKEGAEAIQQMMKKVREKGADLIEAATLLDYEQGIADLPKENVLRFVRSDGSWIAIRPSGTEPKIKCYYSIKAGTKEEGRAQYEEYKKQLESFMGLA